MRRRQTTVRANRRHCSVLQVSGLLISDSQRSRKTRSWQRLRRYSVLCSTSTHAHPSHRSTASAATLAVCVLFSSLPSILVLFLSFYLAYIGLCEKIPIVSGHISAVHCTLSRSAIGETPKGGDYVILRILCLGPLPWHPPPRLRNNYGVLCTCYRLSHYIPGGRLRISSVSLTATVADPESSPFPCSSYLPCSVLEVSRDSLEKRWLEADEAEADGQRPLFRSRRPRRRHARYLLPGQAREGLARAHGRRPRSWPEPLLSQVVVPRRANSGLPSRCAKTDDWDGRRRKLPTLSAPGHTHERRTAKSRPTSTARRLCGDVGSSAFLALTSSLRNRRYRPSIEAFPRLDLVPSLASCDQDLALPMRPIQDTILLEFVLCRPNTSAPPWRVVPKYEL